MTNQALVELSAVDNTSHAFATAQAGLKKFEQASRGAQQASMQFDRANGRSRAGMQQMGYQIQDIAVQLQGGQNPFIVLSQQGSQIASIFGPGGAVVGAMLAVGSIIGAALLPNLFKTQKETETLEERVNALGKSYDELGVAQRAWLGLQQQSREAEKAAEIALLETQIAAATLAQEQFNKMLAESRAAGPSIGAGLALGAMAQSAGEAEESQGRLNAELETATAELAAMQEAYRELVNPQKDAQAELKKFIDSLQEEVDTFGLSDTAIALYTAQKNNATAAQIEEITALRAAIDLKEDLVEWEKEATKAAEEAAKVRAKTVTDLTGLQQSFYTEQQMIGVHTQTKLAILNAAHQQGLLDDQEYSDLAVSIAADRQKQLAEIDQKQADSVRTAQEAATRALSDNLNRQVNSMAAAFDESSAIGKAFYVVQQGMAAANAIISGYSAAASIREAYAKLAATTGNPALAAGGEAHAALSIGLGFATAGAIAGQTLASFDGGGFTGYGARAGGMDGKGGFAAILHPNETVVDHTKGGGATQVNLTIQANDTRGFDQLLQSRRGMLTKIINEAINNQGRRGVV